MTTISPIKKRIMEVDKTSPFIHMFKVFRDELDQHHDRRERIIKASRDITVVSKKIIFTLQRVRMLNYNLPSNIALEVQEKRNFIQKIFESIVPDLQGINAWRYQAQISPGLQEFVEAISLEFYLCKQLLITLEEASELLPGRLLLTGDDYILGIFDLIGELMRFAITTMATSGKLPASQIREAEQRDILADVRYLRSKFEELNTTSCSGTWLGKEYASKMKIMKQCVQKIENSVCSMTIRGQERPKGWVPEIYDNREFVLESY